jgi:hypothetical protein
VQLGSRLVDRLNLLFSEIRNLLGIEEFFDSALLRSRPEKGIVSILGKVVHEEMKAART